MKFDEAIREAQKAFANEMQRNLSQETERFRKLCAITGDDPKETTYAEVIQDISKHHKVDHDAEEARERLIEILPVGDDASWDIIVRTTESNYQKLRESEHNRQELCDFLGFVPGTHTWASIIRNIKMTCTGGSTTDAEPEPAKTFYSKYSSEHTIKEQMVTVYRKILGEESIDIISGVFCISIPPDGPIKTSALLGELHKYFFTLANNLLDRISSLESAQDKSTTKHDVPSSAEDETDLTAILHLMKDRYTDQTADFVRCCNLRCQSGAASALARAIRAEVVQLLLEFDGWPPKKERG